MSILAKEPGTKLCATSVAALEALGPDAQPAE
jgi:hypothetical protein